VNQASSKSEEFDSVEEGVHITTRRPSKDEWAQIQTRGIFSGQMKITSKRLSPHRKPSLMDKLRMDSDPTMVVSTQVTAPRVVYAGGEMALSIRVQLIPLVGGKPYKFSLPLLTLERVDMYLTDTMYVRSTAPVIRAIENEYEFPASPEGGHSQAVNHVFEPTADGKAYENSGCQVKFTIPSSCTPTFKTWNLRRKWVISAEAVFRCLGQQWKANCRGPLVIVSKPSHLAAAEDPDSIALDSSSRRRTMVPMESSQLVCMFPPIRPPKDPRALCGDIFFLCFLFFVTSDAIPMDEGREFHVIPSRMILSIPGANQGQISTQATDTIVIHHESNIGRPSLQK
jgi:hypothetical protein